MRIFITLIIKLAEKIIQFNYQAKIAKVKGIFLIHNK